MQLKVMQCNFSTLLTHDSTDRQKSLFQVHVTNQHVHFMMSLIRHSNTRVTCSRSPKIHLWENKPSHNWFMYCFLELEQELEHLFLFFPISVCMDVSANTHTLRVYPRACILGKIQYVSLCMKFLVNLDLSVCGNCLKTSALLQLTPSAAKD